MLFGCIESPYADVSKLVLKCSYSNGTFDQWIHQEHDFCVKHIATFLWLLLQFYVLFKEHQCRVAIWCETKMTRIMYEIQL